MIFAIFSRENFSHGVSFRDAFSIKHITPSHRASVILKHVVTKAIKVLPVICFQVVLCQ